jgi:hypothetical protein
MVLGALKLFYYRKHLIEMQLVKYMHCRRDFKMQCNNKDKALTESILRVLVPLDSYRPYTTYLRTIPVGTVGQMIVGPALKSARREVSTAPRPERR